MFTREVRRTERRDIVVVIITAFKPSARCLHWRYRTNGYKQSSSWYPSTVYQTCSRFHGICNQGSVRRGAIWHSAQLYAQTLTSAITRELASYSLPTGNWTYLFACFLDSSDLYRIVVAVYIAKLSIKVLHRPRLFSRFCFQGQYMAIQPDATRLTIGLGIASDRNVKPALNGLSIKSSLMWQV
jgi:hypothetical protein